MFTLTPEPGWYSEPSIAVNPRKPSQIVAAFQDPAHVSYSRDGGSSWNSSTGTAPSNYAVSGDVSVAYDDRGRALLCYIAFDKLGTTDYWAHNATRNGIFIRRSLDGGRTWEARQIPVIEHATAPGIPFEDKPYVVADDTGGPYAGNLYVGWTHFTLEDSTILFSRSTDGGLTWSAPLTISSQPGLPRDDTGSVEGFDAAIGPDGEIYALWSDGMHLALATSRDGGRHFGPSRRVLATEASYFKPDGVDRGDGFPQIAIDPRGGKRGGRLYAVWTDYRNGDIDVFSSASSDHGHAWDPPVRVNDDPAHDGADQFMQWAAVDPVSGDLYVLFYDRRADPANRRAVLVLARSADGGRTFRNYAWTTTPFDPADDFIGDYSGLTAFNGCVYGDWTEEAPSDSGANPPSGRRHENRRTIVRVGVARFPSPGGGAAACP
ncbi:MAG TPA: hypothetical protein VGS20_10880 [Candidatus Acidoferrales bacterium]|nr:hypothetical protein [Candidatus Acidoferrales bacterium]